VSALTAAALAAGALAAGALSGTAQAAPATSLPARYAQFKNCPVNNKKVSYCLAASSSSAFTIGSTTLDSNGPVVLSVGLVTKGAGFTVVLPTNGTKALSANPISVPGGLTGTGLLGSPGQVLSVTATPQLVGTPLFNINNMETMSGPTFTLPIDVVLNTPLGLLGSDCTIASATSPITLKLTDGKTKPPKPNKSITGGLKTLKVDSNGVLSASGVKLVDNSFSVSGAANCGLLGLLDGIVNSQKDLPSAAGHNTAILSGTAGMAPASIIRKYLK
jgi:hypothetical protein